MKEIIIGYNEHEPGSPDPLWIAWEQTGELVRCKDCKHFHEFEPSEFCKRIFHDGIRYECWNPRLTDQDNVPTKGLDWFCADGERRGSE
jgi:hypothetical protein